MRVTSPLLAKETFSQPKVNKFLDTVSRNSVKTKYIYGIGLSHFQTFLRQSYEDGSQTHTLESIIVSIAKNEVNVYVILYEFVSYLLSGNRPTPTKLSSNSITLYVAAVRSFLQYYDVEISPSKFKRRVRLPKNHREDEEPLDVADIRRLLLSCNNRRLKSYLLILATGGMRTVEALAIRVKDINFSMQPTKIHIRKEYSKTRVARDIYISDEATKFLKEWIDFRYRDRKSKKNPTPTMAPDDLVFTRVYFRKDIDPGGLYLKISQEFHYLLKTVGMSDLKEGMNRGKITLHSFRRFVKSVISTQVGQDYSEWFLGHAKSPYWTLKEAAKREIYATKIMKYLTFLDYSHLEATGKSIEAKLAEKDREIAHLKERDTTEEDAISNLSDQVMNMTSRMQEQEKLIQQLLKKKQL